MQSTTLNSHTDIDILSLTVSTEKPRKQEAAPDAAKANEWVKAAEQVTITDQASYDYAVTLLDATKGLREEAETHHRETIKKAYDAHRSACAMLKRVDEPLAQAELLIKLKIGGWDTKQKQLEAERMRVVREAEVQRAAELAEAEIIAAEAAGAAPEEVAEIIREVEARPIIVPVASPIYSRAKGITSTPTLKPQVTSMRLLVDYVSKNSQYLSVLSADEPTLVKLVKAMGKNFKMPGVTLVEDVQVSYRKGRS